MNFTNFLSRRVKCRPSRGGLAGVCGAAGSPRRSEWINHQPAAIAGALLLGLAIFLELLFS